MGKVVKFGVRFSGADLDCLYERLERHANSVSGFINTLECLEDADRFSLVVTVLNFMHEDLLGTVNYLDGLVEMKKPAK